MIGAASGFEVASGSSPSDVGGTPHPTLRARRDGWTPGRQDGFIAAIGTGASVAVAAKSVGMSRESAYRLRANPRAAAFAASWAAIDHARRTGPAVADMLDDDAYHDALAARTERMLAEAARRPDFNRWLIRRMGVLRNFQPKRELV